jgi:hypothetical protein
MFQGIPVSETTLPQFVLHELSNQRHNRVSHLLLGGFSGCCLSIKPVANGAGCSVGKFNSDAVNAVPGFQRGMKLLSSTRRSVFTVGRSMALYLDHIPYRADDTVDPSPSRPKNLFQLSNDTFHAFEFRPVRQNYFEPNRVFHVQALRLIRKQHTFEMGFPQSLEQHVLNKICFIDETLAHGNTAQTLATTNARLRELETVGSEMYLELQATADNAAYRLKLAGFLEEKIADLVSHAASMNAKRFAEEKRAVGASVVELLLAFFFPGSCGRTDTV